MSEIKHVKINDGYRPQKFNEGYQPLKGNERGYQPVNNSATRPAPPTTGSVVNKPKN